MNNYCINIYDLLIKMKTKMYLKNRNIHNYSKLFIISGFHPYTLLFMIDDFIIQVTLY